MPQFSTLHFPAEDGSRGKINRMDPLTNKQLDYITMLSWYGTHHETRKHTWGSTGAERQSTLARHVNGVQYYISVDLQSASMTSIAIAQFPNSRRARYKSQRGPTKELNIKRLASSTQPAVLLRFIFKLVLPSFELFFDIWSTSHSLPP